MLSADPTYISFHSMSVAGAQGVRKRGASPMLTVFQGRNTLESYLEDIRIVETCGIRQYGDVRDAYQRHPRLFEKAVSGSRGNRLVSITQLTR